MNGAQSQRSRRENACSDRAFYRCSASPRRSVHFPVPCDAPSAVSHGTELQQEKEMRFACHCGQAMSLSVREYCIAFRHAEEAGVEDHRTDGRPSALGWRCPLSSSQGLL